MIIGCFLNVAIESQMIAQYPNNTIVLLQSLTRHLCCLKIMERKYSVLGDSQQPREEQEAASSDLSIGAQSSLQALFLKTWQWH